MYSRVKSSVVLLFALFLSMPAAAFGFVDRFEGDSAIYSGSTEFLRPNILFIIDNSTVMNQAGSREAYQTDFINHPYPGNRPTTRVYRREGQVNYVSHIDLGAITCAPARKALEETGFYAGRLHNNGTCSGPERNYYLGNLLNYIDSPSEILPWSANKAYEVGNLVAVVDANNIKRQFECVEAGTSGATTPNWQSDSFPIVDGTVKWRPAGSILDMVKDTLEQVLAGARESVRAGVMVFGNNNQGGRVVHPIRSIGSGVTEQETNFAQLNTSVRGIATISGNQQRVNEALWDAGLYYRGHNHHTGSSGKISSDSTTYPSPIQYTCQRSFVIVLTTGNADHTSHTSGRVGDFNKDGQSGYVDDASKWLYESDMSPALHGIQRVQTSVVQLLTPEVERLRRATDSSHGRGSYWRVQNSRELTQALLTLMSNIVNEADTSFIAPVVPTSPENRSYSGERVYLGFFRPISQKPWHGNLKKFGINRLNEIVDKDGNLATNPADGSFNALATSFWSQNADAGRVEDGGAGQVLEKRVARVPSSPSEARTIYSNLTRESKTLPPFKKNNDQITHDLLGLDSEEQKNKLIDYLHGYDSYGDNDEGQIGDRRLWPMGDILHSKPAIVNYNTYAFTKENEGDASKNKTMIFVGTNGGMLHAFRDSDGKELWSFIPDEVVPHLKELAQRPAQRAYYVDASPVAYIYDHLRDGVIGSHANDRVILLFGLRRGGSAYYALDVTDPEKPEMLWKIDRQTPGFGELGQTWSEPQIGRVRVRVGNEDKVKLVAFVGAGYDVNEDGRFGANALFPAVLDQNRGEGYVTSSGDRLTGSTTPGHPSPMGRGIYAIELATFSGGVPTFKTEQNAPLWSFTYDPSHTKKRWMRYPVPSDITILDSNFNGLVDRLYVVDTGGRLWRFNIGATDIASWTGDVLLFASPSDDPGRKAFYRPSVALEHGYTLVAFGSGDRAHPLNTRLVDRFYMVKDKGESWNPNDFSTFRTEDDLFDATQNELQAAGTTLARRQEILDELGSPNNYGWFIRLDQNPGEKVLAPPLIFNRVAYFTTYAPNAEPSEDPCAPGNLGRSRLYAVNYKTGEAVLNFHKNNDGRAEEVGLNPRALSKDGKVLLREDRSIELGVGIPSGIVVIMPPSGNAKLLIGCGGGLCQEDPTIGGTIFPIYWLNY